MAIESIRGVEMNKQKYLIITFAQTTMALYMERVCRADGRDGRIIPLPREIDAGCGLVWASQDRDEDGWRAYLAQRNVEYQRMLEAMV